MRGGAEPPLVSDRRTSFGNTFASSSREGALVDEAWRDAEARSRRGDASAKARWRLVGLGAVASTALLALAMRADLATPPNAIELGDARVTDGGAWGFGADGTISVGASAIGHEPRTSGDVERLGSSSDATEGTTWRGNVVASHLETGGGGVVARHDARDAPDWVRRVAPFDETRVSGTPVASDSHMPTFDPVIDWADEEAEREWPLFGGGSLDGSLKATEATDRRSARAEAGGGRPTVSDDSDSRRAARVRRRTERRAEAAAAAAAAREADRSLRLARAEPPSRTFSNAQPRRGRDWVNPAGVRATFAVNTCGVPPAVRARQAPWPACRVLLVGCPGGRSAPDADPAKPACAEWDVSRALEMVPESDFEKHGLGSFSVTTSMYGPGDEFAFAMVKPGCTDAQIARALRAQGGAGPSDGSEASTGLENGGCEVRLDSGFPMGNQLLNPGTRTTRCWTPNDAVTDTHRVAGDALCESVGASSEAREKDDPAIVSSLGGGESGERGDAKKVSPRESPLSPFEARGDTCLLRRDAAYARGKFHRVVPSLEADAKELGSAVKKEGAISSPPRVSFVWGTCDAQPRSEAWCAPPTFDARRVAAVCGVEYDEPKSVSPESVSPERLSIVSRSSPSSSSSLGADAKEPKGETSANANQRERARPKKTDATAGNDDEPRDEPGRPSANRAPSGDSSSKSPDEKELSSSDKSEKSDASLDDAARQKRAETTKPMTREEQKARAAARAAALRSKSEPLLSDDTATRAEMALVEKEVEGREAVSSGSRSTPAVDASGPDLFASDPDAAALVAPGAWAETPPTRVFFENDAPHAMAHLLLRDGDARFATERLPWAELIVNGAPTRAPTQLARGDVVQLRVRAETEAETEERVESNVPEFGRNDGTFDSKTGVSRTGPPRRDRVATLVIGGRSGSLRARVDDSAEALGARGRRKSEDGSSGDAAEKVASEKSLSETASETGTTLKDDAIKRRSAHMTLDGAAPGTTAHVLEVTAPRAGQWMVLPPVDAPAVIVSGVGEGARAAVTVRFADDAFERPEDAVRGSLDSVSLESDSAAILGADESRGSDRRVAPGGDANGVFAKIDGKDEAVDTRRDNSVSVWTREETMQIARGGALGNGNRKSEPRSVTVKDGDKLRVKVRAGPKSGEATRLAVFVGDKRVGTAVVATAATAEEADAAGAELDGRLEEAKKEAQKEAATETRAESSSRLSARVGKAADVRLTSEDASSTEEEDASSSEDAPLVSLITGREITAEEMRAAPSGSTRVVLAGSRVSLPSAGFMTVTGVLPSAELKLLVHAYEQSAGKEIERRAVADDALAAAEEEKSASLGDDDAWRTARLGTSDDDEDDASSLGASAGAGRLPDWLEVRVEGAVVTPPVPVWLARRISVKLTAAPEAGVARRVVLRAGDQTWQATVVSAGPAAETRDGVIAHDSTPNEVVAAVSELRDDVQTAVERDGFVDGDQDKRLDALEKKNAAEDRDESEQDARVEKLETEVEELIIEVDQEEEDEAVQAEDESSSVQEEDESSSVQAEDESSVQAEDASSVQAEDASSSSSSKLALVSPIAPSRPSETPWLEGSPVDALTHAMLSDEVTATIARAAEDPFAGHGANGSFVATRRVAARFRAVSTPRNHTVFAAAGAAAIAPTPLPRDAALLAASIRLTSAGGVADGVLDVSNATRADFGASAGETVRGLGPDGSCRVVAKAVDETGSVVSVPSPNTFFTPAWARLIVNGALVPRSNETVGPKSSLTLRDGDVVAVAVVAGARAGDARTLLVLCVATDPAFPFDDVMNDPAYADDAAANGESFVEEIVSEYAAPGDAVLVMAATAIAEPTPPASPPPAPSPPFPPAAATLAAAARGTGVPACDEAGTRRREGAKRLIFDRERALPREYDGTDAKPNLCGATRPVCANRADPTANLGLALDSQTTNAASGFSEASANDRDVVFLVDVSDTVTRDAFDEKLTELLLTLFCASHEGTESQAGVVLYPAPKSAETCGAYQVAIPLARYTTREWFDAVEALRSDTSACCGSGTNSGINGAAPLAEALDGAGLEFEARGAHDPKKRLALVVSAGTPAPAVRDESCSESASVAFSSMTRTFPFNEAHSDGGVVNACTYAWKYVPAAARRLERTGARVAAVNVAGDSGSDASGESALTAFGTPGNALEKKDDASFRESWRGAAGAAHFLGAPWPGACGADGHCALSARYGGTLGRWVYANSDDDENDEDATKTPAAALGASRRVDFRYDPGEPRTCSFDLPSDRAGRRAVAVVTEPHAAHLATIHAWSDAGAVARAAARLMCEPSTPHACATEEDDGVGVAFAQCRGAAVPSESTRDDTTACLRGLVMAACGRVDFSSDDENITPHNTSRKCRADGRLLRDAEATDAGLVYGTLACNEVCGDEKEEKTLIRGGRVEVDVTCAPGEACAAGEVRRFAAGASADARRKQSAASDAEVGLFPNLDVETIVAEATPPPPALDSSQGYGIHGK